MQLEWKKSFLRLCQDPTVESPNIRLAMQLQPVTFALQHLFSLSIASESMNSQPDSRMRFFRRVALTYHTKREQTKTTSDDAPIYSTVVEF